MDYTDILIEPVISEKANALREEAVKKLFNVKVLDCTTINTMGKMKRLRGKPGRTSSYKKAIVRLAAGETIQAFEGV